MEKNSARQSSVILLEIVLPSRVIFSCTRLYSQLPLVIAGVNFPSDLVEFDLTDLDVVLGINWLGRFKAQIYYKALKMSFFGSKKDRVTNK